LICPQRLFGYTEGISAKFLISFSAFRNVHDRQFFFQVEERGIRLDIYQTQFS